MQVALYHRVSTVDQDPTTARHELRAAAAARSSANSDLRPRDSSRWASCRLRGRSPPARELRTGGLMDSLALLCGLPGPCQDRDHSHCTPFSSGEIVQPLRRTPLLVSEGGTSTNIGPPGASASLPAASAATNRTA